MDISKVKFCSCLRWLSGMVAQGAGHLPGPLSALPISELLLDPYTDGNSLKSDVIALLSDPNLYSSAYMKIFPERLDGLTFWPLIQGLAKRGVYVLEGEDVAVNHAVLAQTNPFRQASHLALIEGLMSLFASSTLNVERVVKAVRKISTFNPSKELPCGVDDALLLWLNKTAQAVCKKRREEMDSQLHDPDARQRRRNKLKLVNVGEPAIPVIEDLSSSIADGQHLAALLLHYVPHAAKWEDFIFDHTPLSKEQSLHNLNKVSHYCSSHLPLPGFHLKPKEQLLQWAHTGILNANIQALLAQLFLSFEVLGLSKKSSNSSSTKALEERKKSQDTLNKSVFTKQKPSTNRQSLHSYSTSELFTTTARHTENQSKNSTSIKNLTSHVSSFSTSELIPHHPHTATTGSLHSSSSTSSTVFRPPVRSSITAPQAAALAGFNTQFRPPVALYENTAATHSLITVSTDTLGIREQMLRERLSRSTVNQRRAPVRYSLDSSDSSESNSSSGVVELSSPSGAADISGNCTESWNTVSGYDQLTGQQPQDKLPLESLADRAGIPKAVGIIGRVIPDAPLQLSSDLPKTSKSIRFCTDMSYKFKDDCELKSSFTVNKHHTAASASEAGLPIIDNADDDVFQSMPPTNGIHGKIQEVSSSGSSSGSIPSVKHLQFYQTTTERRQMESYPLPSVVEVRKKLDAKMVELKTQEAVKEKQELIERQKFGHKVYLALMQQTRAASNGRGHQKASAVDPSARTLQLPKPQSTVQFPHHIAPLPTIQQPVEIEVQAEPETPQQDVSTLVQPSSTQHTKSEVWQTQCSTTKKLAPSNVPTIPLSPIQPAQLSSSQSSQEAVSTKVAAAQDHAETNPWTELPRKEQPVPVAVGTLAQQKELLKWREQQVKARLDERERARKANLETRRKENAMKKAQQELKKQTVVYKASEVGNEEMASTIHFNLSANKHQAKAVDQYPIQHDTTVSMATSAVPSIQPKLEEVHFLNHNGPECYIRPLTKSNRKIVKNALCYVCLAGDVNVSVKQRALAELESSTANHILVLFRDTIGFKFRALYSYTPDDDHVTKIFGSGPRLIKQHMMSHLYKYNSGLKEFKEVHTRYFSLSVDALTITNHYWTSKKTKPPSGAHR